MQKDGDWTASLIASLAVELKPDKSDDKLKPFANIPIDSKFKEVVQVGTGLVAKICD